MYKRQVNSSLKIKHEDINNLTIEDICIAARNGDELSITMLKEAARYIGIGITNLINILNPTAIVVVGEIFENTTHAIETLNEIVKNRGLKLSSENVKIAIAHADIIYGTNRRLKLTPLDSIAIISELPAIFDVKKITAIKVNSGLNWFAIYGR